MSQNKLVGYFCCIIVILFSAGCASKNSVEPVDLESIDKKVNLQRVWSKDGGAKVSQFSAIQPAVTARYIFIAGGKGRLKAYDRETHELLWQNRFSGALISGLGVGYGGVFGVTEEGVLEGYRDQTGESLWRVPLDVEVLAIPLVGSENVYIQTINNQILAFDRKSGERAWQYEESIPLVSLWGNSQPIVYNDWLIAGLANGRLVALNKMTGELEWVRPVGLASGSSDLEQVVDIDGQFIISGDTLWAAAYQENLISMSLSTGQFQWFESVGTSTNLVEHEGIVYIADNVSRIHSIAGYSGDELWQTESLFGRRVNQLAVLEGYLLAADFDGYIHVLSLQDGEIIGRRRVDNKPLAGAMIIIDDVAYFSLENGKVIGLSIQALKS